MFIRFLGFVFRVFLSHKPPPRFPKRIILIKAGALGDVVMTTPLLQAIHRTYPQAQVTYMVEKWSSSPLEHQPALHQLVVVPDKTFLGKKVFTILQLARQLRRDKFDIAFVLDRSYMAGIFGWMTGAKYRIGFDRNGEGFAHHQAIDITSRRYDGEYYLDLLRTLGHDIPLERMAVYPSEDDDCYAHQLLEQHALRGRKIIGCMVGGAANPGQVAWQKRWPMDKYIALIEQLRRKYSRVAVALFGGPSDGSINQSVMSYFPDGVIDVSGCTVLQSAALMRCCALFITHDTGPMHLAASVGVPVLSIFGPTDPIRLAPVGSVHTYLFRAELPGAACYDVYGRMPHQATPFECLLGIEPNDILEVIDHRYADLLRP